MKPLPFAVSSVLLIAASCINGFVVYRLREPDFLDFAGVLLFGGTACVIALSALTVIGLTTRKALSTHPILCGVALLNVAYPVGKLLLL